MGLLISEIQKDLFWKKYIFLKIKYSRSHFSVLAVFHERSKLDWVRTGAKEGRIVVSSFATMMW